MIGHEKALKMMRWLSAVGAMLGVKLEIGAGTKSFVSFICFHIGWQSYATLTSHPYPPNRSV